MFNFALPITYPMKIVLYLLPLLLLTACADTAGQDSLAVTVVGKIDPQAPLRQDPADKDRQVPALIFRMGEAEAAKGQTVCLPVEVSGFKDILGFQYTVRFDSAALRYETVRSLDLAGYQPNNFGARFADRGYLSTLWTARDVVKGVTLPTNHQLYELCFESLLGAGEETEVRFHNGPTAFEVVGPNMTRYRLVHANGKVRGR